ncbi:DinI-like family protein [Providencia manganoxydans]|uniref:DinI-like family protein n=1 Tax=Providencia TaxID=586 RepID=UPI00112022B7|nr:DinI-like family protein [Providencia stuartii]
MLKIDLKFTEEAISSLPKGTLDALQNEITKKLGHQYEDLCIRIRKSSFQSLDISGVKDDAKAQVMSILEAIWEDDGWLPYH